MLLLVCIMKIRTQNAFTLIEMALTISIVFLLLGTVIKGGDFVQNSISRKLAADFIITRAALHEYQDKFNSLPGDDAEALLHVKAMHAGNGDAIINGVWSDRLQQNSESFLFWQHLHLAGLMNERGEDASHITQQQNAGGGELGVQSGRSPLIENLIGGVVMCSAGVSGRQAKQIDIDIDDGNTATGKMRVAKEVNGLAPAHAVNLGELSDASLYTVCMVID